MDRNEESKKEGYRMSESFRYCCLELYNAPSRPFNEHPPAFLASPLKEPNEPSFCQNNPINGKIPRFLCRTKAKKAKQQLHAPIAEYNHGPCKSAARLGWRNWYTRKTKDLVPKGLRVRVPSRAPSLFF